MSQNIPDKIINHLVSQYFLLDVFEPLLLEENIATRINKGTHYGIKKVKQYLKKHINEEIYILKFDIAKYFFNLDHTILKKIVRKKIKDSYAIDILDRIIDSTDNEYINSRIKKVKKNEILRLKNSNIVNSEQLIADVKKIPLCKKGKSVPIGNMSSQAFAIIYLNELDHYIKNKIKPDFYLRYQDDGLLISNSKEFLVKSLIEIRKIVENYKLKLNRKTRIYSIEEGFEFLGFKYIKKSNRLIVKVKNQTKRRFKKKMKRNYESYLKGNLNFEKLKQIRASYLGHLKYGDTEKLIRNVIQRYNKDPYLDFGKKVIIQLDGNLKIKD